MLGDRETDESLEAELLKVTQTSVDRTSVSLLLTAAGRHRGGVCVGGSEVRGWDVVGQVQLQRELLTSGTGLSRQ